MAERVEWPIKRVRVEDLHLDTDNVRIRGIVANETATLNYLYAEENALGLAREILRNDYVDNELPMVVRDGTALIVVEGNRRLAALKGLNKPDLVPNFSSQLQRLLSRHEGAVVPDRIRVIVAPSKDAAAPVIARLHTGNPKEPWPRDQQARFYHAQLGPSVTVDDLKTLFPSEAGKIPRFIRMAEMRDLIRGMRFDDPQLRAYVLNDELTMTAFEYAHAKPGIRQVAGLVFSRDGVLAKRSLDESQRRVLEHIVAGFRSGVLSTRAPQLRTKTQEYQDYLVELQGVADGLDADEATQTPSDDSSGKSPAAGRSTGAVPPSGGGGGTDSGGEGGDSANGDSSGASAGASVGSSPGTGPNRGHTASRLNLRGISYSGRSAGIQRRLEELRILNVKDTPNAAYYLVRSLLETACKHHLRLHGAPLPPGTTLIPALDALGRRYARDKLVTGIINTLKQGGSLNAGQFLQSAAALNVMLHEPDVFVTSEDVHHAWDRMAPLVRLLLDESTLTQP